MESALSLKANSLILAKDMSYETSKRFIPVCPECKEPVHLRKMVSTTGTSYFAHNVLKGEKERVCSLRVYGYWDQAHTNSGMWSNRGQLIEKIQVELISFFTDQFGDDKNKITTLIKKFIDKYVDYEWIYSDLLEHLSEAGHIYNKVREETRLGNDEGREIVLHYNLAISCLNGSRLHMATQGLLWCSFIAAYSMSEIYKKNSDPSVGVICNDHEVDFCLDPKKYRSLIAGKASYPSQRNHVYYRCVSISQRLLIRLLASWRYPNSLRRNFLAISSKPHLISTSEKKNPLNISEYTPEFRTLEDRNHWLKRQSELTELEVWAESRRTEAQESRELHERVLQSSLSEEERRRAIKIKNEQIRALKAEREMALTSKLLAKKEAIAQGKQVFGPYRCMRCQWINDSNRVPCFLCKATDRYVEIPA